MHQENIEEENIYTLVEQAMQAAAAGNYTIAEQLLLRSYGTLEAQLLHNAELRARVLHLLANSYRNRGMFKMSRAFYERARTALEKESFAAPPLALCEDIYIQALCENDLDLALRSQQDLCQSLQKCGCHPSASRLQNLLRLCALYWSGGKYYEAELCLKEYIQLARDRNKLSKQETVSLLCSLALLSLRTGKLEEAESLYKEALYAGTELQVMNHSEQAEMLSQLGVVLCSQDKHTEAKANCRRAFDLNERARVPVDNISIHFRAIADVYCQRGCLEEASRYCSAALDAFEFGSKSQNNEPAERLLVTLRRLGLSNDADLLNSEKDKIKAGLTADC